MHVRSSARAFSALFSAHRGRALVAALAAFLALGASSFATPERAAAQDYTYPLRPSLEIHAGFAWWGTGFATGARLNLPLIHGWLGQHDRVANALALTVGGDFYFIRDDRQSVYGSGFGVPVTLEWRIHFMPVISLFAELGVNVFFPPSYWRDSTFDYPWAWFVGAIGIEFHITHAVGLVARLGTPYSALGLVFAF